MNACGNFIFCRCIPGVAHLVHVGFLAPFCKKDIAVAVAGVYDLDVYQRCCSCLALHLGLEVKTGAGRYCSVDISG